MTNKSRKYRIFLIIVAIVVAVLLLAAGFVIAQFVESPQQRQANSQPPTQQPVLAKISDEVRLVDVRASARLDIAQPTVIKTPRTSSDMPTVTQLGVAVGDTLYEGDYLADISGEPLIALALPFGLYRDIYEGDSGPDVAALSDCLVRLGYLWGNYSSNATVDDDFVNAMRAFLRDYDYKLPDNSSTSLPATQNTQTENKETTAGENKDSAQAGVDPAASQQQSAPKLAAKYGWFLPIPANNAAITKVNIQPGTVLNDPEATFLEMGGGQAQILSWVDRASAQMLSPNIAGRLIISGDEANAINVTVTAIDAERSTDPDGINGFKVTMSASGDLSAATKEGAVLVANIQVPLADQGTPLVPQTAILTDPSGQASVIVAADGKQTSVPVTLGLCAQGWCTFESDSDLLVTGAFLVVSQQ